MTDDLDQLILRRLGKADLKTSAYGSAIRLIRHRVFQPQVQCIVDLSYGIWETVRVHFPKVEDRDLRGACLQIATDLYDGMISQAATGQDVERPRNPRDARRGRVTVKLSRVPLCIRKRYEPVASPVKHVTTTYAPTCAAVKDRHMDWTPEPRAKASRMDGQATFAELMEGDYEVMVNGYVKAVVRAMSHGEAHRKAKEMYRGVYDGSTIIGVQRREPRY